MRGRRTVEIDGKFKAHPDSVTRGRHVVYDRVSGQQLVIFHTSGASSALDAAEISDSRDVGATGVFDPNIDGRRLQFRYEKGGFVDAETGKPLEYPESSRERRIARETITVHRTW